jgi:16S rRNA processing protein RimM
MTDEWMLIGRVAGPFGVRGDVKVDALTDFPDRFSGLTRVYLGAERTPIAVEDVSARGGRILLRLAGIASPEAVRELRGAEIYVPRSEAAPLPSGHFYLDDAVGLTVRTTDGADLGSVTEILKTGSNEVFVVGRGKGAVLIPVIKDAIAELDLSRRLVVVEPWVLTQE